MPVVDDNDLLLIAFLLTAGVALIVVINQWGRGSDHSVHSFFIQNIRSRKFRLTSRVDRLLNESYYAYPLFLHWLLALLPDRAIEIAGRLLSPILNIVLILLYSQHLGAFGPEDFPYGLACLLFALTPQFYHTTNARNAGLSARTLGMVLFLLFAQTTVSMSIEGFSWHFAIVAAVTGYLIWGTSKFAIQSAVFCGVIILAAFGEWLFLTFFAGAYLLFVLLHPRYSLSFTKHFYLYTDFYRRVLAEIFILKYRYSVWRDLVYDIPLRIKRSFINGIKYAYANPFLIVLFLNPLFIAAVISGFVEKPTDNWILAQWQLAVAGLVVAFLTSFRATRFLGEPERYVEITSPFAITVAVSYMSDKEPWITWLVLSYYGLLLIAQVTMTVLEGRRKETNIAKVLEPMIEQVNRAAGSEQVRFASNNENLTKFLMAQPWSFVKFWSASPIYAGVNFADAFQDYPKLKVEAFENIVTTHHINFCYLDRTVFCDIFAASNENRARLTMIYEDVKGKLFHIRW